MLKIAIKLRQLSLSQFMPLCDVLPRLSQYIVPMSKLFSCTLRRERYAPQLSLGGRAMLVGHADCDDRLLNGRGVKGAREGLVEDG